MTNSNDDIGGLLRQAVGLHQRGDRGQAEALYAEVLRHQPDNFDALHLLGVLARQGGAVQDAIALIGRAIALDPTQAIAHCNLGAALQDAQRPADALASLERALALQPAYPLALYNRGNALRKLGRLDEALLSYDAALALTPAYADALCNRGVTLQLQGRLDEALDNFGRALELQPDHAASYGGAGVALQGLGRYDEALEAYRSAVEIDPDYAEAWRNHGTAMQRVGEYRGALASHERALRIAPGNAQTHVYRGNALRALKRGDEAAAAYRDALACGADAASVEFLLAALGGGPERAPAAPPQHYVAALFDQYAADFDRHLLDLLQYRAPQLLAAALAAHLPAAALDTADLGCGTGLCGPLLKPFSRTLAGVDLSPRMLEQAGQRQVYDRLDCAAIEPWLAAQPTASLGLLAAADVLGYVGALDGLFGAARHALRPGGLFAFTVEALAPQEDDGGGVMLRPSGRYAHAQSYVVAQAAGHGFAVLAIEAHVLRQDEGRDIAGLVAVLALPGAFV